MKRILTYTSMLALLVPAAAAAQARPALEIGTKAGFSLSRTSFGDETETVKQFSVPSGALYVALFPSDNVFVEPEVALTWASSSGESATGLGLVGWVNFAPAGVTTNSLYVGGAPALQYAKFGDESQSQFGAAGRVGYRSIVRETLVVRIEAGFTRWFEKKDESLAYSVFSVQVGFGGLLNRVM